MEGKIDELLKNNIAIKYMSEYSSPALLVQKPGSKNEKDPFKAKYRIVIDLREMNEAAVHLQYSSGVTHVTTQPDYVTASTNQPSDGRSSMPKSSGYGKHTEATNRGFQYFSCCNRAREI